VHHHRAEPASFLSATGQTILNLAVIRYAVAYQYAAHRDDAFLCSHGTHRVPTEPTAGAAFVQSDRALDHATSGPLWLKDPRIANIIAGTLEHGANQFRVTICSPGWLCPITFIWFSNPFELPTVTDGSKDPLPDPRTLVLGRTGEPFWQYKSYNHRVRSNEELRRRCRPRPIYRRVAVVQRRQPAGRRPALQPVLKCRNSRGRSAICHRL
jgi:hypothetical protein